MHLAGWYLDFRIVFTPSLKHEIPNLVFNLVSFENKFGAIVNWVLKNLSSTTVTTFCQSWIRQGSSVLFYFSGHGFSVGGDNFLVPALEAGQRRVRPARARAAASVRFGQRLKLADASAGLTASDRPASSVRFEQQLKSADASQRRARRQRSS